MGGAVQMIGKAPETLMQAGSQMAGQVSQSLGGLMKQGLESGELERASRSLDPALGAGKSHGGGAGGGGTMSAGVVRCRVCPR